VFCGPSCVFTNDLTPRSRYPKGRSNYIHTIVKKGASIGANATIICGCIIGKYALIGSGAVVTKNVRDYSVVVGVPARQMSWICKCGEILTKYLECNKCGCTYVKIERNIKER